MADPHDQVRVSACESLTKIRDSRALRGLIRALGDESFAVRLAATKAMGFDWGGNVVSDTLEAYAGASGMTREYVADFLTRTWDTPTPSRLIYALEDKDESIRNGARRALEATLGANHPIPLLGSYVLQPTREVAGAAKTVVSSELGDLTVPILLDRLASGDVDMQRAARTALTSMWDEPTTARLTLALLDEDHDIRQGSRSVLRAMGRSPEAGGLMAALCDGEEDVRLAATSVLEQTWGPITIPRLLNALGSTDEELKRGAYEALTTLWTEPTASRLLASTGHSDPRDRQGVSYGVGQKLG